MRKIKYLYHLIMFFIKYIFCWIEILNRTKSNEATDVVISITSFGSRINYRLILTLKSLINQSIKTKSIFLSLSNQDVEKLPRYFKFFIKRNKEIKILTTKSHFRSYNKFIPLLEHYPGYGFITVDDDIIYDFNFVKNLIKNNYKNSDKYIVSSRWHLKTYMDGKLNNYSDWKFCSDLTEEKESKDIFITTGGGVYFPSNCISINDFNWQLIKKYFYTVDDVYINKLLDLKSIIKKTTINKPVLIELYDPRLKSLNLNVYNSEENINDRAIKIDLGRCLKKIVYP